MRALTHSVGLSGVGLLTLAFAGCGDDAGGALTCDPPSGPGTTVMVDATDAWALTFEHHVATEFCEITDTIAGPGVCAFDYDRDGQVDVFFADRAPFGNVLYRNAGGRFVDVSKETGVDSDADSMGCLVFDYDGDGYEDLFVSNVGRDQLFRNDGGVGFTDVTDEVGFTEEGFSSTASAGDIDGDGDLDLFVAQLVELDTCIEGCNPLPIACDSSRNLLYENRGGTFVEVGAKRGITEVEPTLTAAMWDHDRDGDLDLYVGNDIGLMFLDRMYVNDGTGNFVERASELGFSAAGSDTMGFDVGDYDRDGVTDAVSTDFKEKPLRLYHCFAQGTACSVEAAGPESLKYVNWAIGLVDFNQDGWLDIFQTGGDVGSLAGDKNQLFFNDGTGAFDAHLPTSGDALDAESVSRGAAFADFDGDGDVDVVVANVAGRAQLLLNESTKGHYLRVAGTSGLAGAMVTVTTKNGTLTEHLVVGGSYLGTSEPVLHFGVGDACQADVSVQRIDGRTERFAAVAVNQTLEIAP